MRRAIFLLPILSTALVPSALSAQTASRTLDVYVIDVEGGNATPFVSPNRESLRIDTGNAGATAARRDAGRIEDAIDAIKDAGLQQIDHLIVTHWHGDHFGGLVEPQAGLLLRWAVTTHAVLPEKGQHIPCEVDLRRSLS